MLIRFFNDIDPANPQKERLLIGIAADDVDRGQAREAVRVATEEDVETYAAAYEAYKASFAEPPAGPDDPGGAEGESGAEGGAEGEPV